MKIPIARCVAWFPDTESFPLQLIETPGMEILYDAPDISFISARNRRRLSAMAKAVLYCADRCCAGVESPHIVFTSRHGEMARTMEMLSGLAEGQELSPTDFSLSVHNATAGIFSIGRSIKKPISALGAGDETFGWGLVEAFLTWQRDPSQKVLFLHCDDQLPESLSDFQEKGEELHAAALLIGKDHSFQIDWSWENKDKESSPGTPLSLCFLKHLAGNSPVKEFQGRRMRWEWNIV